MRHAPRPEREDGHSDAPCRLFVYLARDTPVGVVLRRGPSDWARLSVWHTDTDRIEHGQWIKGRVYERRSDLSSDGAVFAAFVRQSGGRGASDTWVALSRPPYFTALALWFIGGTYYTGAFFPQPGTLWLGFMKEQPPDVGHTPAWLSIAPPRDVPYIDGSSEWTERTVHFNRLLRDGWRLLDKEPFATLWEHRHPKEPMTLTMIHTFDDFRSFGGPYVVEYTVRRDGGPEHTLGQATWADWDQRGRLVLAQRGRLLTWDATRGLETIADLNDQAPDPQPAPEWATRW
ncbi:MAG TPA: hypothetical protein VFV95_09100 [Vicinamibacterales bacterium]|nr:hypothetical protein [Vicinamibacterales bacterium]